MEEQHGTETRLVALPQPEAAANDGAADHLPGLRLPAMGLPSNTGEEVDLSSIAGRLIVFGYPMMSNPSSPMPVGWDLIPGARGCTAEACSFRDRFRDLQAFDVRLYGLSTQDTTSQREAAKRLRLPYPLLSDSALRFTRALRLPTFEVEGQELLKRLTLILNDGVVQHVFYPVFPPQEHAAQVIDWLRAATTER